MSKKYYEVEIVETRAINIVVEAENEDEAFDKATHLHETSDEICEMLNDPNTCIDSTFNVNGEVNPHPNEKIYKD